MLQELTKNGRKLFFNSVIGFGYIFAKRDSHLKERPSYIKEGNDPYQVLKRIKNSAYKIDLLGEFSVRSTFNIVDLSPFYVGDNFPDSRTNPFEKWEDEH